MQMLEGSLKTTTYGRVPLRFPCIERGMTMIINIYPSTSEHSILQATEESLSRCPR